MEALMKLIEIWDTEYIYAKNFLEILRAFIKPKVRLGKLLRRGI